MKISVWTLLAFLLGFLLGARAESRLHKMMGCELLDVARIDFKEEDERCFYFSSGDCEIGIFKDSGVVAIVPSKGGEE